MTASSCSLTWGENPETVGPFGIDYAYVYECSSSAINPLIILIYFVWIAYLINLLAQTAGNYLSPTLSKICEKLHVAYDVAGVTFLAFGNGAPDFFSLIASFSGGVDILVGIGALLGGSMFVCTVVVGSIAILSPCEVSKRIFLRDISFHLIAILAVSIIALVGRVYLPMVIILYAMYVAYVLMVVISSSRDAANHAHQLAQQKYLKKKKKTISVEEMEMQTAFWHIDSTTASKYASASASANSSISMKRAMPMPIGSSTASSAASSLSSTSSTPFASSSSSAGTNTGGYSFLLLSSKEEMKGRDKTDRARRGDEDDDDDQSESKDLSQSNNADEDDKESFYQKKSITISGGAPLDWDRIVVENYYNLDKLSDVKRIMVGEESAGGINSASAKKPPTVWGLQNANVNQSPSTFTIEDDDNEDETGVQFNPNRRRDNFSGDHGEGVRLIDFTDKKAKATKATSADGASSVSFLQGAKGLEASLLSGDEDEEGHEDEMVFEEPENVNSSSIVNNNGTGENGGYSYYDYRRLIPRSDGPNAWKLQTMYGSSVLTAMYWQQWTLRRSLRHRLVDDWRRAGTLWEKISVIVEAPASFARDLTIPTLEEAQWSKMIAMMHPIAAPIFALWILGFLTSSTPSPSTDASSTSRHLLVQSQEWFTSLVPGISASMRDLSSMSISGMLNVLATSDSSVSSSSSSSPSLSAFEVFLLIALSAGASLFIFLATNTSRPPHSWLFAGVWALSAFVMCILWIYALAGELITILSVLGVELKLPPAFLGLTVLAWGNSIGDFFTNTAVAKQGYGTMALAGCYGGPVFNLLIGFGSSLLYATVQAYYVSHQSYYVVALDVSSWVSLAFIIFSLASTIVIVVWREYRMDRLFGIYLLVLYALYSVAQAIVVMVERSK